MVSQHLRTIDPSDPARFVDQSIHELFALLRRKDPIHLCESSPHGPYWSILGYTDIVNIEADPRRFSSRNGFTFADIGDSFKFRSILSSDGKDHTQKRRAIAPLMSLDGVQALELTIQRAVDEILDELPIGEKFDWVNAVSIKLTGRMLATMMGVPQELYPRLIEWTNTAAIVPGPAERAKTFEEKDELLKDCYEYFLALREFCRTQPKAMNFISLLAQNTEQDEMPLEEFLLFVIVLLVGGNETTRNSISGSALFLHQFPDQRTIFYNDPTSMKSGVSEIVRFQTPLNYMRRTATEDIELGGKLIRKGDKVILWYMSGNRDPSAIEEPDQFIVKRPHAGRHLAFGFGPHRCIGRHLAEMQIRILWQSIIDRQWIVEPGGVIERTASNFINGFERLDVVIAR